MRMSTFASLGLSAPLLKATDVLGFKETTPVQAQSIPPMLSGKDVIAKARTGSGKTVAFALGLLSRTDVSAGQTQALILCPTRELADQVAQEIRKLARFIANTKVVTLCGGVPARHQVSSLRRAPLIVVGTPGRVLDHLKRETLFAHGLRVFVLDEADRMLDMGILFRFWPTTAQRRRSFFATHASIPKMSPKLCLKKAPLPWRCTAIWNNTNAMKPSFVLRTKAPASCVPPTWPLVAST